MTDVWKLLDAVFDNHGGVIRTNELHQNMRLGLEQQIESFNELIPRVPTVIINNLRFNAVASKKNDDYFIGIYLGLIIQIAEVCYCFLSDPTILVSVGDPSIESSEDAVLQSILSKKFDSIPELRYLPRDPVRLDAAQRIAECAYLILFFHEVAHIDGHHLEIIADDLAVSEHNEVMALPVSEEESLLLRTLELEADSVGLINSLNIWRARLLRSGYTSVASIGATASWKLSAEILFIVMGLNNAKSRSGLFTTHPSVFTRFLNMQMLQGFRDIDQAITDAHEKYGSLVLGWAAKNKIPTSLFDNLGSNFNAEELVEEYSELKDCTKDLWSKIEEYDKRYPRIN